LEIISWLSGEMLMMKFYNLFQVGYFKDTLIIYYAIT